MTGSFVPSDDEMFRATWRPPGMRHVRQSWPKPGRP
jgi:hypothetical protein